MTRLTILTALLIPALSVGVGCKKDNKADSKETPAQTQPTDQPAKAAEPAAETGGDKGANSTVAPIMVAYEACRDLLAADKSDGIAECAKNVEEAAKAARTGADDATAGHLDAVATAATELAAAPGDDIDAARMAFGKLSEPVIALLRATPAAADTYHVFECPMAKGFKQWVQPDAELENPYMGTRMLACGSELEGALAGAAEMKEMPADHGEH